MAEYDNTNRGVLFRNERKKPGEKFPDYQGNINFNGVECQLAAWVKEFKPGHKKAGQKFLSLSVTPPSKEEKAQPPKSTGLDDDIPF